MKRFATTDCSKQFGTTNLLGNDPTARDETFNPPAQTRNLGDEPATSSSKVNPAATRNLSDDGGQSPFQTRNLDDVNSPIPPPAASAYLYVPSAPFIRQLHLCQHPTQQVEGPGI